MDNTTIITGGMITHADEYTIASGSGSSGQMYTTGATGVISNAPKMKRPQAEQILDRYALNELVVQHRVQEFELMKLRETDVDYAEHIKQNLAKNASEQVVKKMTFTKKTDKDTDTHSFRGRVWIFSKEELLQMIGEIRNGI